MVKKFNRSNFHTRTFCIWKEVDYLEISGLKINYKSKSGSQYIFTKEGIYRISNHWGRVADCHWRLIPIGLFKNQNTTVAYANWVDFHTYDDNAKLFFIRFDISKAEVNFYHKDMVLLNEKVVFRDAKETAKTIKIIKEIQHDILWAKYLKFESICDLRQDIIHQLVTTSESFISLKKKYL